MFEIELFGDFHQLVLEEWKRLGRHGFSIDPAPNCMAMTPSFLFMKDDHTGLVDQTVLFFDGCNRLFEGFDSNGFGLPSGFFPRKSDARRTAQASSSPASPLSH